MLKSIHSSCNAALLALKPVRLLILATVLLACSGAHAGERPQVIMKTDLGSFRLELFAEKAPASVENFLRYCNEGFYAGTIFHRVIANFVVQGGGLTFDYVKKETRDPVVNESDNGLRNRRGTVAMARLSDPDSATSQFFINLRDNKHLDADNDQPGYTVFGHVIEGMNVLREIAAEPQGKYRDQAPDLPVRILSVTVLETGTP